MGCNNKIEKCFLTGLPVEPVINGNDSIDYLLRTESQTHLLRFDANFLNYLTKEDKFFLAKYQSTFKQLLNSGEWIDNESETLIDMSFLHEFLYKRKLY